MFLCKICGPLAMTGDTRKRLTHATFADYYKEVRRAEIGVRLTVGALSCRRCEVPPIPEILACEISQ